MVLISLQITKTLIFIQYKILQICYNIFSYFYKLFYRLKSMNLFRVIVVVNFFILPFSHTYSQDKTEDTQSYSISENLTYSYHKPTFFDMIKYIPKDLVEFGKFTIAKKNLLWTGLAIGATGGLIPLDQKITDNSIELGKNINWDKDHSYSKIGGLLRVIPNDINSAVYYIGNGGTTLLLSAGFYTFGKIKNDYRSLSTANQLVEVLLSVGVITQTIKRVTGRQSPSEAMDSGNPGGHWTPFPSFNAYQAHTPNYDAMPSGHLATFMATITVIATNYPEVKWIKPIGYSLAGIMAFEMVSSKVHWASDYPLAILIGYVIGKNAANRRITKEHKVDKTGAIIQPRFKTDFNFGYTSQYKSIGVTIQF